MIVDSVVEYLKCRDYDRLSLGSKPTRAILLCPGQRHFMPLSPAWWSWQAVLNFSHISIKLKIKIKNFKRTAVSLHLQKQVGEIACPMY